MNPILKIILSRLAMGMLTLLIVTVIIFSAVELLLGDIATETLGQSATPETLGLPHGLTVHPVFVKGVVRRIHAAALIAGAKSFHTA